MVDHIKADDQRKVRVVVVTGLSGSGKSTAIKAFEDLDFFCVDNLPVILLPDFLRLRQESPEDLWHIALGMDIRERSFLESYPKVFGELRQRATNLEILFLDASDDFILPGEFRGPVERLRLRAGSHERDSREDDVLERN